MKKSNIFFLIIEILLLFLSAFVVYFTSHTSKTSLIVYILSLLNSFCLIFNYFLNTDKIVLSKKILDLRIFEDIDLPNFDTKKQDLKYATDKDIQIIFDKIMYSLQLIEISSGYLYTMDNVEKRITASKIINENISYIKKFIGRENSTNQTELERETPFELSTISPEDTMLENITIMIYGPADEKNLRLRLILQSFGFFSEIISTMEEVLFSIEDNLAQFLIIQPENKNDDAFILCKKIREKHSLLNFPILVLVKKYNSYLINQCHRIEINDFIILPFDISELITRILALLNYRQLYQENANLLLSEKEKQTFLYFITHNINTPLTILLNEINVLSEYENQNPQLDSILININESANQINSIVQNVLNSYKLSDGKLLVNQRILSINEILQIENIYLAKKALGKKQTFECSFENDDINIFCDENSLKCIYVNLVDNAIKYAPINGKIKIKVFTDEDNTILQVLDNGNGIPKEKQTLIFSRFSNIGSIPTGKEKSLGLGLYVVSEMCKLNGLQLSYSENPEEESGSCFMIKFPKLS